MIVFVDVEPGSKDAAKLPPARVVARQAAKGGAKDASKAATPRPAARPAAKPGRATPKPTSTRGRDKPRRPVA